MLVQRESAFKACSALNRRGLLHGQPRPHHRLARLHVTDGDLRLPGGTVHRRVAGGACRRDWANEHGHCHNRGLAFRDRIQPVGGLAPLGGLWNEWPRSET